MRRAWVLVAILVGCASPTRETIIKYEPGATPQLMRAPGEGEYRLVSKDEPKGEGQAVRLKQGELLGFRQTATGVKAVAGEREIAIGGKAYVWRRR